MPDLSLVVNLLQLAVNDRTPLALENSALCHQLAVYKRVMKRPLIKDGGRIFWLTVMRNLKEWREALVFVQPATLIKWHRKGFCTLRGSARAVTGAAESKARGR